MNCEAAETILVQIGRNQLLDARLRAMALDHARACRHCGLRLTNERMLSAGLGMVADEYSKVEAPEALERAVMESFHLASPGLKPKGLKPKRTRKSRAVWTVAATIAAGLAIFGVVRPRVSVVPTVEEQGFISLPYAEPLGPNERAELQTVRLTLGTLKAMGLDDADGDMGSQEFDSDDPVNAELVVGQDGIPRAVRISKDF